MKENLFIFIIKVFIFLNFLNVPNKLAFYLQSLQQRQDAHFATGAREIEIQEISGEMEAKFQELGAIRKEYLLLQVLSRH